VARIKHSTISNTHYFSYFLIFELPFASVSKRVFRETIHMKMCNAYRFIFMQIKLIFIYERVCTKTRFKTEAQGNSEMAYLFHFLSLFFSYFWQLLNAMRVPTSQNLLEEPCVKATKLKRLPAIRYCSINAWQWNTPCILDNWARGQSSKGTVPTALRVTRTVSSIVSARIVTI